MIDRLIAFFSLKTVIIIAAILLIISNAFTGYKAYGWGADDKQAEWDKAVAQTIDQKIDIKENQDAIQSAPIDVNITVRRLRAGTF